MGYNASLRELYDREVPGFLKKLEKQFPDRLDRLTGPFLMHCWDDEYGACNKRLMVVGKETNEWHRVPANDPDAVPALVRKYEDFRLGTNPAKPYDGNFLPTVRKLHRALNGEQLPLGFMWNNLWKLDENCKSPSQCVQSFLLHEFPILRSEIEACDPQVVVFFTSYGNDEALRSLFPGATVRAVPGFACKELAEVCGLGRLSFRTYHPGYFVPNPHRVPALKEVLPKIVAACKGV